MINIRTSGEIAEMKEGGSIAASILRRVLAASKPGITTKVLDVMADDLIAKAGAQPSFKMEKGYHWATCMNLNGMVVHGIPTDYKLVAGDKLGVDLGVFFKGWHVDTSWTILVQSSKLKVKSETQTFLETGERALEQAIKQCKIGNHIGDISSAMQKIVEGSGYSCVKQLVGHGVGKLLHEDPEIPCFVRGKIERTPEIKEGMVLAIEVIYNMGGSQVAYANDDGWTIVTRDGLPSAVFEHTVAVTNGGPVVLTA